MRQRIAYHLTLLAIIVLIGSYASAYYLSGIETTGRLFLGIALTILPLLYYLPSAIKRQRKTYVILALIAPFYLFYGGVIWLWGGSWQWGLWFCTWAVLLEIGAILHNFVPKKARKTN